MAEWFRSGSTARARFVLMIKWHDSGLVDWLISKNPEWYLFESSRPSTCSNPDESSGVAQFEARLGSDIWQQ